MRPDLHQEAGSTEPALFASEALSVDTDAGRQKSGGKFESA